MLLLCFVASRQLFTALETYSIVPFFRVTVGIHAMATSLKSDGMLSSIGSTHEERVVSSSLCRPIEAVGSVGLVGPVELVGHTVYEYELFVAME